MTLIVIFFLFRRNTREKESTKHRKKGNPVKIYCIK
jgi:hypothetical protein